MHIELQQAMQHLVAEQSLNLKEVSRFTPVDFRLGIQYLVAQDQPDLAQALAEAGLALPGSHRCVFPADAAWHAHLRGHDPTRVAPAGPVVMGATVLAPERPDLPEPLGGQQRHRVLGLPFQG